MLKKYLSKIYYSYVYSSPFGYRFRQKVKKENILELKPFSKNAAISDLFVWRAGTDWLTTFQLFNISSFLFPEDNPSEDCEIHIFDACGKFLKKIDISLQPFELKRINFQSIDGLKGDIGTFSVFHFSKSISKISQKRSHITERGYISYQRTGEILDNYCHGNLQSVSKKINGKIKSIIGVSNEKIAYYPQMIFSDCTKFELLYVNPSSTPQDIKTVLRDYNNKVIQENSARIDSFGVHVMSFDNLDRTIHTIQNYGHIMMWRPLVLKFYESHFDILHG